MTSVNRPSKEMLVEGIKSNLNLIGLKTQEINALALMFADEEREKIAAKYADMENFDSVVFVIRQLLLNSEDLINVSDVQPAVFFITTYNLEEHTDFDRHFVNAYKIISGLNVVDSKFRDIVKYIYLSDPDFHEAFRLEPSDVDCETLLQPLNDLLISGSYEDNLTEEEEEDYDSSDDDVEDDEDEEDDDDLVSVLPDYERFQMFYEQYVAFDLTLVQSLETSEFGFMFTHSGISIDIRHIAQQLGHTIL